MKLFKFVLSIGLLFASGFAYPGETQPAPVDVDLAGMTASGDMVTARRDRNDEVFIGCAIRIFDSSGVINHYGYCQAEDADGDFIFCYTQEAGLLDAMKATSDYSYITFNWEDDGNGGMLCNRIGFSTQSFYLPRNVRRNPQ